jgi:hypothetical protein
MTTTQESKTAVPSTIAGLSVRKAGGRTKYIKLLVYGDAGAGKTRLAASAYEVEAMRPIIYVDVEGGSETFQEMWPEIEIVTPEDERDKSGRLKQTAWERYYKLYQSLKETDHGYKTVIVDNLTEVYDLCRAHWLYHVVQDKPERDEDLPAERDWVKQRALMRRMFRLFRDLPMHVIFTAHREQRRDDNGRLINHLPAMPGKVAYDVAGFVGELVYLWAIPPTKREEEGGEFPKGKRRLLSQPIDKFLAKDRSDKLPMYIENPTMKDIAALVLDKGGK